jgi:hypothetical protein
MVLEMQGKGDEARAITSKMRETEALASVTATGEMLEECAVAK